MILNNYWNLFAYTSTHWMSNGGDVPIPIVPINNANHSVYSYYSDEDSPWKLRYPLSARVGTGTTAPTLSDYCLDNDVTSSISSYTVNSNTAYSNNQLLTTITISGQNNTANPITITEIGITKYIRFNDGSHYYENQVLLVRELLDEPVEVPSGEGFTINFEWAEG